MTEEERKALLDTPAFGPGSEAPKEEVKEEPVVEPEGETTKEEGQAESEEESKVPYSRFKKFHDSAKESEAKIADLEAKIAELSKSKTEEQPIEVPQEWIELWGDSDISRKAYERQMKFNNDLIEKAKSEALETLRAERFQEEQRIEKNLESIDSNMETLSDYVGRELTEKEQESILDIVDEYTPSQNGKYIGATLPFEKAWEIYQLKEQASKAPKKASRDAVASLSGTNSEGETNDKEEKDKAFNPLNWDAWKGRI